MEAAQLTEAEAATERLLPRFGVPVATGRFGADMRVTLTNDGPVTLVLDSRPAVC